MKFQFQTIFIDVTHYFFQKKIVFGERGMVQKKRALGWVTFPKKNHPVALEEKLASYYPRRRLCKPRVQTNFPNKMTQKFRHLSALTQPAGGPPAPKPISHV